MVAKIDEVDVVVVGAGIAGLTAAWELHRHGVSVQVLEKEDWIGGRTRSVEWSPGVWVNLGAQYVGGDETPVGSLLRKVNLRGVPFDNSTHAIYMDGRRCAGRSPRTIVLRLPMGVRDKLVLVYTGIKLGLVHWMLAYRWTKGRIRRSLDARTVASLLDNRASAVAKFYRSLVVRMTSAEPQWVSAYLGLSWLPSIGFFRLGRERRNQPYLHVDGGTECIARRLAADLDGRVHTGVSVVGVVSESQHVTVSLGNGDSIKSNSVIVATPANVTSKLCRNGKWPELSWLEKIQYGGFVTVAISLRGTCLASIEPHSSVHIVGEAFHVLSRVDDLAAPAAGEEGIFVLIAGGEAARLMLEVPDDSVVESAVNTISKVLASADFSVGRSIVQRWPQGLPYWEPGRIRSGRFPQTFERIVLAGDYLDHPNLQGAYRSGLRAADLARRIADGGDA